ncbi:hypothetical protein F4778DRAFT_722402 [Xylariomycetidae sp. FL2044]|nr:hypothetical protein F4778DRAFT_722402 [Xylariomycetidae sp. FL2044]
MGRSMAIDLANSSGDVEEKKVHFHLPVDKKDSEMEGNTTNTSDRSPNTALTGIAPPPPALPADSSNRFAPLTPDSDDYMSIPAVPTGIELPSKMPESQDVPASIEQQPISFTAVNNNGNREAADPAQPASGKRGRPRGQLNQSQGSNKQDQNQPAPRKRGRPKKHPFAEEEGPRKRGRPRKYAPRASATSPPKSRDGGTATHSQNSATTLPEGIIQQYRREDPKQHGGTAGNKGKQRNDATAVEVSPEGDEGMQEEKKKNLGQDKGVRVPPELVVQMQKFFAPDLPTARGEVFMDPEVLGRIRESLGKMGD